MKKFIDIDNTGKILQSYYAETAAEPMEDFVLEVAENADLQQSYVDMSSRLLIAKGPQPSQSHIFDWQTKKWADPRTLQTLKDARNRYINDSRLAANQKSFAYLGEQIAADTLSRGDIETTNGVVLLTGQMPTDWIGGWRTVANTYVPIPDVATWKQFYLAMNAQGSLNFAHAQALKTQLASATTAEQVEAVVWGALPSSK